MKTSQWCLISAALAVLCLMIPAQAQRHVKEDMMQPPGAGRILGSPQYAVMTINNITSWSRYDGQSNHSPAGDDGAYYPRGTGSFIYQDGVVWGGKVFTDAARTQPYSLSGTQNIRVGGGTYGIGTRAGKIITPSVGPSGTESPSDISVRIYRIRRDYANMTEAELRRDASAVFEIPESSVNFSQTSQVQAQYGMDWTQWPVSKGAPFIERNGVPGFQPPPEFSASFGPADLISGGYDEPGVAGADPSFPADQVIWTVYNDLTVSTTTSFVGSYPLGLEIQKTVWAYERNDDLANVIFNRYKIINKGGVDISTAVGDQFGAFWIDSMFVCQWSDPDVGNAGDDLLGCDSSLSLGYAYNGSTSDGEYARFQLPPPAGGYDFLAGPIVPSSPLDTAVFDLRRRGGFRNLGMSSFAYFSAGSSYNDPPTGSGSYLQGTGRWWKMLRGFAPLGDLNTPDQPYAYPPGGSPSKYPLSGDPTTGSGLLDGLGASYSFAPGDRRLLMTTGPFSMAPGDTQEVVTALLAGLGADRLSSVAELRYVDQFAQMMYNSLFSLPDLPVVEPVVTFPNPNDATIRLDANDTERSFSSLSVSLSTSSGASVADVTLYDDGSHDDGAAADGRFGGSVTIARRQAPLLARMNLVPASGPPFSLRLGGVGIVTAGEMQVLAPSIVHDNVGQDGIMTPGEFGRFVVGVRNHTPFSLSGVKVIGNNVSLYGGATTKALSYNALAPGADGNIAYDANNDSTWFEVLIPDRWTPATYTYPLTITDSEGNLWRDSAVVAVSPRATRPSLWSGGLAPFGGPVVKMIQDSAGRIFAFPGTGAYRSTDAGMTWQKMAGNDLAYIYGAEALPDGTILAVGFRGIYRSTDHGVTWSFRDMDASTAMCVDGGGFAYVRTNGQNIVRSTDGGVTWTFLSTLASYSGASSYLISDGGQRLFTYSRGEVDRSLDSGKTWSIVLSTGNTGAVLSLSPGQTLFFGTDSSLYRSTNLGSSWQTMALGVSPTRISRIAYGPGGEVYAGQGGDDYFMSTDNGVTWSTGSGMFSRAHTVLRAAGGVLLGSARGMLTRSTDGGASWTESSNGYAALTINGFGTAGGTTFMATNRGIFRSTDQGATWDPSSQGFSGSAGGIVAGTDGIMYSWNGSNLYRSLDGGFTWSLSKSFVSGDYAEPVFAGAAGPMGVAYIGLGYPRTSSGAYRTPSGRVLKTTDGGISWQSVMQDDARPVQSITKIAVNVAGIVAAIQSNILFVSTDAGVSWTSKGYAGGDLVFGPAGDLVSCYGDVRRTTDLGSTWTFPRATGLFIGGQGYLTSLAYGASGNMLVGSRTDPAAGTVESGIFRSIDGGETFSNVTGGLGVGSRPYVTTIHPLPAAILVGTSGEGFYRTTSLTGVEDAALEIPSEFRLEQNYPNPFNPATMIRYSLPVAARVTLRIYNVLGQLVDTIVMTEQSAGVREVVWNAERSPSGMYICRLEAKGIDGSAYSRAMKMMMVK